MALKRTEDEKLFLENLGHTIRVARKEKKYSQTRLAFRAGIDLSGLSGVENGYYAPGILTLRKICAVLNIKLIDLLSN